VGAGALLSRFAEIARDDPTSILIYAPDAGRSISASEIWAAHLIYADRLARAGVESGALVLSAAGNAPAAAPLLLACRALDAAVLPVDAGATRLEIDSLAARFGAAAVVGREVDSMSPLGDDLGVAARADGTRRYPGTAMLKLTSGSTGAPKATLTTEAQLAADCTHIVAAMDVRPGDIQIAAIPVSHSYGLGNLLLPLLLQGTACVMRDAFVPPQVIADARRFGARVFPGVPFMFQYFVDNPPAGGWPPALGRLISAGAPLAPATVRAFHDRFGVKIHTFYGASETGGIAFDADDDIDGEGAVGAPLPGVTISLRDDDRVHVRSDAVSSGYSEPAADDGFVDGGFLTGDFGAWDARGRLLLRGRASAFVNVAGRKVVPDEVEQVLRAMPGVADARIVAAPDRRRGQQIVACIVRDAKAPPLDHVGIRRYCAARLAAYKIPRAIVFVDAIPRTARGKIDRAALDAVVRAHVRA
jgi:long-chain acyl-CoA synthetase